MENTKPKKSLLKKLTYHYRILIINDDTYEEKFSFKLNRLNVFVFTTLFALLLIVGTTVLIAFTPIRTYIPGYTAPGIRKQVLRLAIENDSLKKEFSYQKLYIDNFRKVLNGKITMEEFDKSYTEKSFIPDTLKLQPGKADSLLRKTVAERERFKVNRVQNKLSYDFTNPVKGIVVNGFNPTKKHFGIDVTLDKGTPVKSIADGVVLYADFANSTGNTIIVKHQGNVISIYKHNAKLLRKTGDKIKKGEVIALSGNSGEKTTGPHLHFELWIKEFPVNPTDFISFK